MEDRQRRNITRGIALITGCLLDPHNPGAAVPIVEGYRAEGVNDTDLAIALLNISTRLLLRIEELTDRGRFEELQHLSAQYGEQ